MPGKTRPNPPVSPTVSHEGALVSVHAVFDGIWMASLDPVGAGVHTDCGIPLLLAIFTTEDAVTGFKPVAT